MNVKLMANVMLGRALSCKKVGELLQHYLDGELDQRRAKKLARHLEDCRRCGLEAETYERIKASLAQRSAAVPPDVLERLRRFADDLAAGNEHED